MSTHIFTYPHASHDESHSAFRQSVLKIVLAGLLCLFSIVGGSHLALAQIPAAPTGLSTVSGTSKVNLSWSAVTGATSYNVYRSDAANGEGPPALVTGVSSTSYLDQNSGIANSTHYYYYKVTAVNASGQSALSAETVAIPLAAPVVTTRIGNNYNGPIN